ncbi:MAG: GIY-YIG nuclease family protein [Bryobacteraceae bacterium]
METVLPSKPDRKQAIQEFKQRKVAQGIYAVRCAASGRVWVHASRNLAATRTGLWFALRSGGHINRALQAEWNAQGEESFQFEILEQLEDDLSPMAAGDLLKSRKKHWLAALAAQTV